MVSEKFSQCPHRRGAKSDKEFTIGKPNTEITAAVAAEMNKYLVDLPTKPTAGYNA